MIDILHTPVDTKKHVTEKPEIVFTAMARPRKETVQPDISIIQSIDAVADELQASDTIDGTRIKDITTSIEKMQTTLDGATRTKVKDNLASLQKEMDALEIIEVADALAAIDSPWGELAKEIAESDRLKQSLPDTNIREQYVDKLLFPLGAEIFSKIRSMTADPLTRQLMFHSVADDIRAHPERILKARESVPQPKNAVPIKNSMQRVSLELLGVRPDGHESETRIDSLYRKSIHTAVLRSRLAAEQPLFDIAAMEHMLEATRQEASQSKMPFAKEEAAQTLRETRTELNDMKKIRLIIDRELPHVRDEVSLMKALDTVHHARFEVASGIAPYKLEPWAPDSTRTNARAELELLSKPKEDMYAKVYKKLGAAERKFKSGKATWSETKYKDHMKWLADPVAQANRNQRIINAIDLVMTLTTLVYGTTGGIQRQIEGNHPNGMSIKDYINYVESQRPWEVAADLATPKAPKRDTAFNAVS